jgi:hypothetical protein
MPFVIVGAAIATAVSAAATAITVGIAAITLSSLAVTFATSLVLGGLSMALQRKPKAPSLDSSSSAFATDRTFTVRQPDAPWTIIYGRTRAGGSYAFIHVTNNGSNVNAILHLIIIWADHRCDDPGDAYFDDELVTFDVTAAVGRLAGYVTRKVFFGDPDQLADAAIMAAAPDKWTANHRLRGKCFSYYTLQYDANKFPTGVPNITQVVRGKTVYDPRDGAQDPADETTWEWSDNVALCLCDYLCNAQFGPACDYLTEIDEDLLIEAANICDEAIALAAGGTEKRYTCNGSFTTDEDPETIITNLCNAMAGNAVDTGGKWRIYAGAWRAPTAAALTEDDLRGPYQVQTLVSARENFNGIKGKFISPADLWQPVDFPAVISSGYAADDNGEEKLKDISLPWTDSGSRAQRLAKIELLRARQPISTLWPCKLGAFRVQAIDVQGLTSPDLGWDNKPFEVRGTALVLEKTERGGVYMGFDLQLRETAANVWDWSSSEEQPYDAAPNTNFPNPFDVVAPTNLILESGTDHLLDLGEGSVIARIFAVWTATANAFVEGYQIRFKPSASADWPAAIPVENVTSAYLAPVKDGVHYDVAVRAVNALGVKSDWLQAEPHLVIGKTEPPPTPTSFTVQRTADGTRRYAWTMETLPADVRSGGGFNIYYLSGGGVPALSSMTLLNSLGLIRGSPFESNELAAGTYAFALTTVDSSANESDPVYVEAEIGDPRLRNVLLQRFEHELGWPGTKTGAYVDSDIVLRATGAGGSPQSDWASLAGLTWAGLAGRTWETITARGTSIIYRTPIIDLGTNVSFTPLPTYVGEGSASFRMATGASGQSPTVDGFFALGAVSAKRFFQLEMTVIGAPPNAAQLTLLLDSEVQLDEYEDVNTATESAVWFQRVAAGHIRVASKSGLISTITSATIRALQNVGAGASWELISKSALIGGSPGVLAAEFKIYNGAGALVDATIDVELQGPKVS